MLDIAKSMTIQGAGQGQTVLAGGGKLNNDYSVVRSRNATVTLRGLSVIGANGAAAIEVDSGTLTLEDVLVRSNVGKFTGGIVVNGGTLILGDGTSVTENRGEQVGGISVQTDATLRLNAGSSVTQNTATATSDPYRLLTGGVFTQGSVIRGAGSKIANNAPRDCVNFGGGHGC